MVLVKICGIRDQKTAQAAIRAGADALGFHIGDVRKSKSIIHSDTAAKIIEEIDPSFCTVLVTTSTDAVAITELARKTNVVAVQFHGEIGPKEIQIVKRALPALKAWKTIHVVDDLALEEARRYEGVVDQILLDTGAPDQAGGTGKTHDWNISKKITHALTVPVVLAGGLNPENVADAARAVEPYMVDVNSGVSNPDGSKDMKKVKLFIERAKGA